MSRSNGIAEAILEKLLVDMRASRLDVDNLAVHLEPASADHPARVKVVMHATIPAKGDPRG